MDTIEQAQNRVLKELQQERTKTQAVLKVLKEDDSEERSNWVAKLSQIDSKMKTVKSSMTLTSPSKSFDKLGW